MHVRIDATVTHACPYVDEVDVGFVTIEYDADGDDDAAVLELHQVRSVLDAYAGVKITHEAMTEQLGRVWPTATVTTHWRTAGLDVEVTTGRRGADDAEP